MITYDPERSREKMLRKENEIQKSYQGGRREINFISALRLNAPHRHPSRIEVRWIITTKDLMDKV